MGIAGLIHRGKSADVGSQLTSMLQALKHRGPDSTGFALYGNPRDDEYVMRFKSRRTGRYAAWVSYS